MTNVTDETDPTDPAATLEAKLARFADSLTDDELTVLHDVVHLACESSEVQGFAMPGGSRISADPCEGGEVTFAGTFSMLANLHVSLHRPPPTAPGPTPTPYPNRA